jgi:hypothetical protein
MVEKMGGEVTRPILPSVVREIVLTIWALNGVIALVLAVSAIVRFVGG